MEIHFQALLKKVSGKALISLDKEYDVLLRGGNSIMGLLFQAPSDAEVDVVIKWPDSKSIKQTPAIEDDKEEEPEDEDLPIKKKNHKK